MRTLTTMAWLVPLLATGCQAQGQTPSSPAMAEPRPAVQARHLALPERDGAALGRIGALRVEAGFSLHSSDARFGGFSGIWLDPDGARLILTSDRGVFWSARLEHGVDDRLVELADWQAIEPQRLEGDPGARYGGDAEALTGDGAGGLVVAYESAQRLRRFALGDLSAAPTRLPRPDELKEPSNTGIEALVTLADGTLLALAEGLLNAGGDHAAWLIAGGRIERLGYLPAPGFAPTGADRLDDMIYVLERRFSWLGGFRARVVALPAGAVRPGARLVGRELARLGPAVLGENFEGLAARRARDGRVLLYLVSDDNFLALQQTLLIQLSLEAAPSPGGRLGEDVGPAHQGAEGQQ